MITHEKMCGTLRQWPVLLVLAVVLAAGDAGATRWLLKIDGIAGAPDESGLPGWTVFTDLHGQLNGSVDPTNRAPGVPVFACEIRKSIDELSPLLMQGIATGQIYRRLNLASVPTNGVQYRIVLDAVRIASLEHRSSTNPSAPALEERLVVHFTTGRMELAALDVGTNGGVTGGLTAVFNASTGEGRLKSRMPFRAGISHNHGRAGVLVEWPAEAGHRYRILSCAALGEPWRTVAVHTGLEDGLASCFVATPAPALFFRVEEVD